MDPLTKSQGDHSANLREGSPLDPRRNLKDLITKSIFSAQQEMVLTLPQRLLMAFRSEIHREYRDPETDKPFASFYRWLMTPPPPGCGLASSRYMDAGDIIYQLQRCRERMPADERGPLNGLIEEMVKGYGAAKPAGRPKKGKENINGTVDNVRARSSKADTLAARLAESSDPKVRKEWKAYLEGKHGSVTRAAIACGMIEDTNAPLARLKQNWRKASAAERRVFVKFIFAGRSFCSEGK